MPDHLTVTFPYSPAEHANALADDPERRAIFKWWVPFNIVFLAVLLGWQGAKGHFSKSPGWSLVLILVTLVITAPMILMPQIVKRTHLRRFRRHQAQRGDAAETRTFGPDGFISGPQWSEPVPWSFITRAVESERFFFIYHASSQQSEYVPKAAMSQSDIADLRTLLQNELPSRHAVLQLLTGET